MTRVTNRSRMHGVVVLGGLALVGATACGGDIYDEGPHDAEAPPQDARADGRAPDAPSPDTSNTADGQRDGTIPDGGAERDVPRDSLNEARDTYVFPDEGPDAGWPRDMAPDFPNEVRDTYVFPDEGPDAGWPRDMGLPEGFPDEGADAGWRDIGEGFPDEGPPESGPDMRLPEDGGDTNPPSDVGLDEDGDTQGPSDATSSDVTADAAEDGGNQ
jgi:hypothetical protein